MAIEIFEAEKNDGLEIAISANASIALCSEILPIPNSAIAASFEGQTDTPEDLFYTKSIFVSSVWNLNTDVFLPAEVWKSRNTPVDKPTNNSHNEMKIVGHITSVWAVDGEGKLIPEDTKDEDLPDLIHLCNSAVIYTHWRDRDLKAASENLIADIKAGEKFVSMECFFDKFDYAMQNDEGKFQIVPRNSETSFLTKHLHAYGGSGEFDGFKLGRVLRDFTFSGKGYVDRPANPASQIFDFKNKNVFSFASTDKFGVYVICGSNSMEKKEMSDTENKAVAELTSKLELAIAETAKATAKVADLEKDLEAAKSAIEVVKASETELLAKVDVLKLERDGLASQLSEIASEKTAQARLKALVDKGFAEDVAKAKVEQFKSFSNEQFDLVLSVAIKQPEIAQVAEVKVETEASTAGVNVPAAPAKQPESAFAALAPYLEQVLSKPASKEKK